MEILEVLRMLRLAIIQVPYTGDDLPSDGCPARVDEATWRRRDDDHDSAGPAISS